MFEIDVKISTSSKLINPLQSNKNTFSQFHQHFMREFFVRMVFWQLFLVTFWLWGEIRTKNLR